MKYIKKYIPYFIAIGLLLAFNINFAISRFIFTEKYPYLTQTQVRQNFINIFLWNHQKPNK